MEREAKEKRTDQKKRKKAAVQKYQRVNPRYRKVMPEMVPNLAEMPSAQPLYWDWSLPKEGGYSHFPPDYPNQVDLSKTAQRCQY
jgi:hypothetical protein